VRNRVARRASIRLAEIGSASEASQGARPGRDEGQYGHFAPIASEHHGARGGPDALLRVRGASIRTPAQRKPHDSRLRCLAKSCAPLAWL